MDPINILIGINIVALFGANVSGAKKGLKSSITEVRERPKTSLQTVPTWTATIILIVAILGVFQLGTLQYLPQYMNLRVVCMGIYIICSWTQIWSYKQLGDSYSQEIVIFRKHVLVQTGPYKYIRHPQYLAQIITDAALIVALLSYAALPLLLVEIPLFIRRGLLEEKILKKHFPEEFAQYKSKTGFMIPFIG